MSLQKNLLQWFDKNQRPLPWRKHYRPYEVWISEIMLQQTQMETVLPYFKRWMKWFPDVSTLASARPDKALKAWQGLGYYSRARNLHESAKRIIRDFGGNFPAALEEIRMLKGVGRYTAGAIASIAFNRDTPIVDGNILRVLSRVYAIKTPVDVPKNQERFWDLEEKLIPKGHAREFNQALMELGALVCSPAGPSCPLCPIRSFCKTGLRGDAENYPVKQKKTRSVKITAVAAVLEKNRKFFIHRRPLGKIMGGLWEFPEWKLSGNTGLAEKMLSKRLLLRLRQDHGIESASAEKLGVIQRNYTYFNETLHAYRVPIALDDPEKSDRSWESAWVPKSRFSEYPFSSAHAKIAQLILEKK